MTTRREDLLEVCLRSLRQGSSIDEALAPYPEAADGLRPLLEAAQAAASLSSAGVPRHALVRSRNRLLQRASSLRPARLRRVGPALARPALAGLLAALALLMGAGSVAAAQSLPGDDLYGVKILAEDVMLRLASGPEARIHLEETFDGRRAAEVRRLVALGRVVPVTFSGPVQDASADALQVADIRVRLGPMTHIEGDPQIGTTVEVVGTTQPDGVLADEVRLTAFDVRGLVESIQPDAWVIAGRTLAITRDTLLQSGLAVGDQVVARVLVALDGSLALQRVERAVPPTPPPSTTPATPTPPASATPTPTPTTTATFEGGEEDRGAINQTGTAVGTDDHGDSEDGGDVELRGVVQAIGPGQWTIGGRIVRIDGSTEIKDNPQIGDSVRVTARRQSDGSLLAEKIEKDD